MTSAITNPSLFWWRERPFACPAALLGPCTAVYVMVRRCTQGVGGVYTGYVHGVLPLFSRISWTKRPESIFYRTALLFWHRFHTVLHRFLLLFCTVFVSFISFFVFYRMFYYFPVFYRMLYCFTACFTVLPHGHAFTVKPAMLLR